MSQEVPGLITGRLNDSEKLPLKCTANVSHTSFGLKTSLSFNFATATFILHFSFTLA